MSEFLKRDLMVKSGLGEEVIKSFRKEKYIEMLTSKLQEMIDNNEDTESMARKIVDMLIKDKNYE